MCVVRLVVGIAGTGRVSDAGLRCINIVAPRCIVGIDGTVVSALIYLNGHLNPIIHIFQGK